MVSQAGRDSADSSTAISHTLHPHHTEAPSENGRTARIPCLPSMESQTHEEPSYWCMHSPSQQTSPIQTQPNRTHFTHFHMNIISRESVLRIFIHYSAAEALTAPDFGHHVMPGAWTELLIDTHLKTPLQSHFFTGHNSHQGLNSHSLSLPSHPHV